MALVSYGSDGSSGSEDEEEQPLISSKGVDKEGENGGIISEVSKSARVKSTFFSKFIEDDEDGGGEIGEKMNEDTEDDTLTRNEENPVWSKFLPQPKKAPPVQNVQSEEFEEIGPIPPKKTYGDEEEAPPARPTFISSLSTSKVQGKVRISIPFLNSLQEDTSEDDTKRKYVEPSKKGSGLFSILPQPKNSFTVDDSSTSGKFLKGSTSKPAEASGSSSYTKVSSTQPSSSANKLIPDSVKNKLKRPSQTKLDEIKAKLSRKGTTVVKRTNDSDDSDDDAGDFFSFNNTEAVDPEALEKLKLPTPNFETNLQSQTVAMEVEEQEQNYQQPTSSRSDDLMRYIQPKRNRKKEDVQVIDINADDLRPDNTEWLKNITDESAIPVRQSKGMGGISKRKHQITYLAFEAKAREQELKNQWAQNRANRMATNNKYGF